MVGYGIVCYGMVIYVSDASLSGPPQYASACPTTSDTAICLPPICAAAFSLSLSFALWLGRNKLNRCILESSLTFIPTMKILISELQRFKRSYNRYKIG